ncbi:Dimethylglycine dehydrogenase, mitochondrial [Hondaea fermentalgiana]|uniref:Dimethylglycine dehydrogenase, mitochondrial n=1 Tax=Hondaea fermentalgiana TaxID=2315210 RepID=A0A2R5GSM3_9STRA|nr:Dimethylglycine dehydrogenase, mitochondrial [Hondaea fermentalgiana]|eukprot:GBG33309.1 Dimethylglycine dehydrogenase, mitochondrial [Hondaea fermentalgiana]
MAPPKNVVVVGGGVAGATISRVLAAKGVQVTLLEKAGQLCSGATWHAAGLVTRFAGSPKLKKIHVRSLELMTELHDKHNVGLHTPGSIRIIEKGNEGRLREAHQHVAMAKLFDDPMYPTTMISRDEVAALHPLLDTSDVECGVYTPYDGDVDPTSLTNTVARLAREDGAKVRYNAEVTKIEASNTPGMRFAVHVKGDDQPIECDTIVNAAGLWSRGVSDMVPGGKEKLSHPAFVIEHQYAITDVVPQVRALAESGHNGGRLPVLRDLKGSSYIRQEGHGFLIGPYENQCIVRTDMPRGPPSDFIMELFPDELSRIEENLMLGMELVPCLGEVGFKTVVNGPTIWTGDSLARVGRTQIPGWYDFNSLTYGIAQSLGLSEYLGHIMLEGEQPKDFDASSNFDPLRYGPWLSDSYTVDKITETYTHNNAVVYNFENRSGGRENMTHPYPLHDTLAKHGAKFGAYGGAGCEVPMVFVPEDADIDFHDQKKFHEFNWAPYAEAEAEHALKKAGFAYSSFSKIRVTGKDAKSFMGLVTTGALPVTKAPDTDMACRLTYATTPKGRVQTEFTICRMNHEGDDWYLVGGRDYVRQDMAWLLQQADDAKMDVQMKDLTDDVCVLHVCGPNSGMIMAGVDERVKGLPFMRARTIENFGGLEGVNADIFRVSFTGEMGYELHFPSEKGPEIHDLIWNSQGAKDGELRHIGSQAIDSLRVEKGFKFRGDLDFAHYKEAGIMPFVSKKRDFLGKDHENAVKPERLSAMFTVDTPKGWEWSVVHDTPITRVSDGAVVAYTTTSSRGAITGKTVAIGYTLCDKFNPDDEMVIETFGYKWPVHFEPKPLGEVNRDVY